MKISVASLVLAVATAPAFAADAGSPAVDRLVACAEVQDSLQRLVCFDREIAPLARAKATARTAPPPVSSPPPARSAAPVVPAPVPPPAAAVPPATAPPSFGQEQLDLKTRPAPRDEDQILHANIASIRPSGAAFVVALDNGQTWRHEDQTLGAYLREGEAVTIRKATLGSYRLTRDAGNEKNWIRVTRIR